jgi:hypothetical protein
MWEISLLAEGMLILENNFTSSSSPFKSVNTLVGKSFFLSNIILLLSDIKRNAQSTTTSQQNIFE